MAWPPEPPGIEPGRGPGGRGRPWHRRPDDRPRGAGAANQKMSASSRMTTRSPIRKMIPITPPKNFSNAPSIGSSFLGGKGNRLPDTPPRRPGRAASLARNRPSAGPFQHHLAAVRVDRQLDRLSILGGFGGIDSAASATKPA